MWWIYNILFFLAYMVLMPAYLLRMRRRGGYRQDFGERFGIYAPGKQPLLPGRVWVHAVSVGEALVALPLIQTLRAQRPDLRFLVSVTTSTGHALIHSRKHPDDVLIYFPLDFPWIMRRVAARLRPSMLVLTECELWPNLLRYLNRNGVPVFIINGRISQRSYRGYRRVKPWFWRAAQWVSHFLVQTADDAARLKALGVAEGQITVTGSAKYDVPHPEPGLVEGARRVVAASGLNPDGALWVMGSTWPEEERVLVSVFKQLRKTYPLLQAILVPRHMERRQEVEQLLVSEDIPYVKRSDMENPSFERPSPPPALLLADTTGELQGYYSLATLVYVGKSLCGHHGGQNPIEPAALGKPVITGPNMENFPGVMEEMLAADAVVQVRDEVSLLEACCRLLGDQGAREALAERARSQVDSRRGVMARTAARILPDLDAGAKSGY